MKKLPIGIQTFSEIINENYCYIDKTPLIYKLVTGGKYYFLSRPRRFGKSLLVSTLAAAFSGQKALFKGLYLESHWDWETAFPVFNVSLGRGVIASKADLEQRLNAILIENAEDFQIQFRQDAIADRFAELIRQLHNKFQQPVVILIDEYDKPILDSIEKPDVALEIRDGLKNFYSVIKDSDAHIKFALLTGVSKFSKVSLFSGLNNLMDITLDSRYATLCGYTETEIRKGFPGYLDDVNYEQLRAWYNGYNFLGDKVYNPFDILLYLDQREFKNYWFETGNPTFLLKLIQKHNYSLPNLENLQADDSLLGSFDVEKIALETLLFQTGYLTIEKVESLGGERFYTLSYPNREVKSSLNNAVLTYLTDAPAAKVKNQKGVYFALIEADFVKLEQLFHAFFASIPHDWYRKNQLAGYEGYYASIVYCYFAALGLDMTAEESSNKGQIDLSVRIDNKVYLLEFKVSTSPQAALEQIKAKSYHEKFLNQDLTIYLLGITFDPETRNILSFEWEQG